MSGWNKGQIMSNAEEHDNEIVIRIGNPEITPGNPESYRKMAMNLKMLVVP